MKNTPLTSEHIALGAKMANFAGYNMPITYPIGIKTEHQTVREKVGMFDVSHMGEFLVEGKGALPLIQEVTSNNAAKLAIGQAQYSCLPNHEGGIVDDLLVYKMAEEKYLLVVNASNIEKDWNWIVQHNKYDAKLTNISDDIALLAVQGPKTAEALQSLTSVDLANMKYYTFEEGTFAGIENVIISATGYTGSGGFELYIPKDDALHAWKTILEVGKDFGIEAIGLAARDTLRLEMGFALYGNDINDTTSPIAAGLGWITKTKKGQFNSVKIFQKQRKEGTPQKLVGFELIGRGIPRHDYLIVDADDNEIGIVTSGTHSPSLGKGIGMGYVNKAFSKVGSEFFIAVRKKRVPAVVVKLPFYVA